MDVPKAGGSSRGQADGMLSDAMHSAGLAGLGSGVRNGAWSWKESSTGQSGTASAVACTCGPFLARPAFTAVRQLTRLPPSKLAVAGCPASADPPTTISTARACATSPERRTQLFHRAIIIMYIRDPH